MFSPLFCFIVRSAIPLVGLLSFSPLPGANLNLNFLQQRFRRWGVVFWMLYLIFYASEMPYLLIHLIPEKFNNFAGVFSAATCLLYDVFICSFHCVVCKDQFYLREYTHMVWLSFSSFLKSHQSRCTPTICSFINLFVKKASWYPKAVTTQLLIVNY